MPKIVFTTSGLVAYPEFTEHFDGIDLSQWVSYTDQGEMTAAGGLLTVGNNLGSDERCLVHTVRLPVNPLALYCVRCRLRNPVGATGIRIGVAGLNAAGQWCDGNGSTTLVANQHFVAARGTAGVDWTEYVGYFQGHNDIGSKNPCPDIASPGKLHTNVTHIAPLLIVNYNSLPGITEVDYFTITSSQMTFAKGRVFPIDDTPQLSAPVDYSEGGQLYAYDKGILERLFYLTFERLSLADYLNFDLWLTTIARGPVTPFAYTDESGAVHTVRLLDTKNPLREVSSGLYSGTITLREEIL